MAFIVLAAFIAQTCVPYAHAQAVLPDPGVRLNLSPAFAPPLLKGVKVYTNDPFRLDFILDKGDGLAPQEEANRLVKYFLAALTVPEEDLWVNLSPYEKDRIVPDAFGQTEMGRDLLAQDYILKQVTASLLYPEGAVGKDFWAKIYAQAQEKFGTTDIPVDTFNKVWIVPEKATVFENKDAAFVVESRLKVMLESDYLASDHHGVGAASGRPPEDQGGRPEVAPTHTNELAKNIIREIILPILEKEINEGKNFAQLRQVYYSLILATWFKDKIKQSILGQAYVDQKKISGVDITDKAEKDKIWAKYVEAFKKGAFNLVKEEQDDATGEMIPRKYFSGGAGLQIKGRDVFLVKRGSFIQPQDFSYDDAEIIQFKVRPSDAAEGMNNAPAINNNHALFKDGKIDPNGIVLVHALNSFPQDGVLYPNNYYGDLPLLLRNPRSIVEFSFNGVINLWQNNNAVVLIPLSALKDVKPMNLWYTATSFLGPVKIPQGSTILVKEGVARVEDVERVMGAGIDVKYFSSEGALKAAQRLLPNMGYQPMSLWSDYFGPKGFGTTWRDPGSMKNYADKSYQEQIARQFKDVADALGVKSAEGTDGYDFGYLTGLMEQVFNYFITGAVVNDPLEWQDREFEGFSLMARSAVNTLSIEDQGSAEARKFLAFADFYERLYALKAAVGFLSFGWVETLNLKEKELGDSFWSERWESVRGQIISAMNEQCSLGLGQDALKTKKEYFDALGRIALISMRRYGLDPSPIEGISPKGKPADPAEGFQDPDIERVSKDTYRSASTLDMETVQALKKLGIKAGDKMLSVGPGLDIANLLYASLKGAQVDVNQPEYYVPVTGLSQQPHLRALEMAIARIDDVDAKKNINVKAFPIRIQEAGIPASTYDYVTLLNVLDGVSADESAEIAHEVISAVKNDGVILLSAMGDLNLSVARLTAAARELGAVLEDLKGDSWDLRVFRVKKSSESVDAAEYSDYLKRFITEPEIKEINRSYNYLNASAKIVKDKISQQKLDASFQALVQWLDENRDMTDAQLKAAGKVQTIAQIGEDIISKLDAVAVVAEQERAKSAVEKFMTFNESGKMVARSITSGQDLLFDIADKPNKLSQPFGMTVDAISSLNIKSPDTRIIGTKVEKLKALFEERFNQGYMVMIQDILDPRRMMGVRPDMKGRESRGLPEGIYTGFLWPALSVIVPHFSNIAGYGNYGAIRPESALTPVEMKQLTEEMGFPKDVVELELKNKFRTNGFSIPITPETSRLYKEDIKRTILAKQASGSREIRLVLAGVGEEASEFMEVVGIMQQAFKELGIGFDDFWRVSMVLIDSEREMLFAARTQYDKGKSFFDKLPFWLNVLPVHEDFFDTQALTKIFGAEKYRDMDYIFNRNTIYGHETVKYAIGAELLKSYAKNYQDPQWVARRSGVYPVLFRLLRVYLGTKNLLNFFGRKGTRYITEASTGDTVLMIPGTRVLTEDKRTGFCEVEDAEAMARGGVPKFVQYVEEHAKDEAMRVANEDQVRAWISEAWFVRIGGGNNSYEAVYEARGAGSPLAGYVIKVPYDRTSEARLEGIKQNMGGIMADFNTVSDVRVNGKECPFVVIQKKLKVFEKAGRLSHVGDHVLPDGTEVSLTQLEKDLVEDMVARGVYYPDALIPKNYGLDETTGKLYLIDFGDAEIAERGSRLFDGIIFEENDTNFYGRKDVGHWKFHKYAGEGRYFDSIGIRSDDELYALWATRLSENHPVPDVVLSAKEDPAQVDHAVDQAEKTGPIMDDNEIDEATQVIFQAAPAIVKDLLVKGEAPFGDNKFPFQMAKRKNKDTYKEREMFFVRIGHILFVTEDVYQVLDAGFKEKWRNNLIRVGNLDFWSYANYTFMSMIALLSVDLKGKRIIDAGAGRGLLSLFAAKLGASELVLIDMDTEALDQARADFDLNGVRGVEYAEGSAADLNNTAQLKTFLEALPHTDAETYVISNIGRWAQYSAGNNTVINLIPVIEEATGSSVSRFLAAGYTADNTFSLPAAKEDVELIGSKGYVVKTQQLGTFREKPFLWLAEKQDAAAVTPGGIDLNTKKMPLNIRSSGEGIQFSFDPSTVKQFQNASGFTPVIISIQPMTMSLPSFLGISDNVPAPEAALR